MKIALKMIRAAIVIGFILMFLIVLFHYGQPEGRLETVIIVCCEFILLTLEYILSQEEKEP